MTLPTSIGASQYSALAVASAVVPGTLDETNLMALFNSAAGFDEIINIRDMPSFGTPANIVKVPVYGQAQTQSIGAQSDAPDLELTINYVPSEWAAGTTLGDYVGDGISRVFQLAILRTEPTTLETTTTGLGPVPNALIYFVGKMESLLITPARDDSDTATLALSIQSDFYGPYTQDPT